MLDKIGVRHSTAHPDGEVDVLVPRESIAREVGEPVAAEISALVEAMALVGYAPVDLAETSPLSDLLAIVFKRYPSSAEAVRQANTFMSW